MAKAWIALAAALLLACTAGPAPRAEKEEGAFFDKAVVERLVPGKSTRQDVLAALGQPYPDPLKSDQRWTYMYTYQKQIIFFFEGDVLKEKRWSEEYGIGLPGK